MKSPLFLVQQQLSNLSEKLKQRELDIRKLNVAYNKRLRETQILQRKLRESDRKVRLLEHEKAIMQKQLLTEKRKKYDLFNEGE